MYQQEINQLQTAFQGCDHSIFVINFEVNVSTICLIYLGKPTHIHTEKIMPKLATDELISGLEPWNLSLLCL